MGSIVEFMESDIKKIREALTWSHTYFSERDLMNSAVHCAEVKWSPITELVSQAIRLIDTA